MKLILNRSDLANKLSIAKKMTASRPILPSTSHFLLEGKDNQLVIKSTDTQVSSNLVLEAEVSGNTTNQVSLPADLFSGIISNLNSEEVELEFLQDNCKVIGGKAKATVKGLPVEDFPELPRGSRRLITLSAEMVSMLAELFAPFVVQEGHSDMLQGVWIWCKDNVLRFFAQDGYRASYFEQQFESEDFAVNIPAKGRSILTDISGKTELWISENKNHTILVSTSGTFSTTLLGLPDEMPNIKQFFQIDNAVTEIHVSATELFNAIKLVSIFSEKDDNWRINFETREDKLHVLSQERIETGDGVQQIDCEKTGVDLNTGLSAKYLTQILTPLRGARIIFKRSDVPVFLQIENSPYFIHRIMPVV